MKVLVTNPPWPGPGYGLRSDVRWPHRRKDKFIEYPTYLAYLCAIFKKAGMDVVFVDGIIEELSIEDFAQRVHQIKPEMMVMECSTPSIEYDLLTAKTVKQSSPNTFILLVGSHPTVFHEEIMKDNESVDGICRGEFDYTARDTALALANKENLSKVLGLTYRENGKVKVNENRPLIKNLDEIPFPDRSLVHIPNYVSAHYSGKNATFIISSRGCPYGCIFCLWPRTLYGRKTRFRSPENVVEEIAQLKHDYGVKELYFDDDCVVQDRERLIKICQLMIKKGLTMKWFCQARVTVDEEMLRYMKESGCHTIFFGVESGDPEMLKRMKKGITLDQVRNAFKLARKLGIKAQAFFMFGLPGETDESRRKTIKFAKEIKPYSAQFATAVPHPGTVLYETCMKKGWLKFDSWEDFDACNFLIETPDFNRKVIERARAKAYRSFYLRPGYIFRTALTINNWPEAKRVINSGLSILNRLRLFKEAN